MFITKNIFRTLVILLTCVVISSGYGIQAYAYSKPIDNNTSSISPQADIIEWRYKVENGKLYKRQYNCTQDKWIGDWILVS